MISLFGCKSYSPTAESITGSWVAKDGAILQLNGDGFDEINNAISLPIMKFNPTASQYFKLLFLGKINIQSKDKSKISEKI